MAGMLVDRARTECMNHLKKLCLKFRNNVCRGLHFVRDNEVVCVWAREWQVGEQSCGRTC